MEELERRIGTVVDGKWRLEKLLGAGAMAAVYAARHHIGSLVAIKILHAEVARSEELRARFVQEAHAVNRFRHAGAVEVRDVGVGEDGAPFMVMELLEGESLRGRVDRLGVLPLDETLRHADELLDVLAVAHAAGVVHRDIKLDNLLVLPDGRLKVLDFGIARVRQGIARTMLGEMLGTITYMPPEQAIGDDIDERADLYAVGAVMFRLIAGRRVHEGRTESEVLTKLMTTPVAPLASIAPQAPEAICRVVDRALAFYRDRRYPDARTMQGDVRTLRHGGVPPHATLRLEQEGPPNEHVVASARAADDAVALGSEDATRAPAPIDASHATHVPLAAAIAPTVMPTTLPGAIDSTRPSPGTIPMPVVDGAGPPPTSSPQPLAVASTQPGSQPGHFAVSAVSQPQPWPSGQAQEPERSRRPFLVLFALMGAAVLLVTVGWLAWSGASPSEADAETAPNDEPAPEANVTGAGSASPGEPPAASGSIPPSESPPINPATNRPPVAPPPATQTAVPPVPLTTAPIPSATVVKPIAPPGKEKDKGKDKGKKKGRKDNDD